MKFAFASLVCLAAALMPASQAAAIERRDGATQANPEFGINLANRYRLHGGAGLPAPKDIKSVFPECKWRHYNGKWGWMDDYNVQCYLSPSYKEHAYSVAKAFNAKLSTTAGACFDSASPYNYPTGVPKYSIAVPYLFFNNLYDRRCKVRALVKVPKTDEHDEFWVQAWVIDHDGGYWDKTGKENTDGPQDGILIDTNLYGKFFDKAEKDPSFAKTVNVEWFFLDMNTQS